METTIIPPLSSEDEGGNPEGIQANSPKKSPAAIPQASPQFSSGEVNNSSEKANGTDANCAENVMEVDEVSAGQSSNSKNGKAQTKEWKCKICGKCLTSKSNWTKHVKRHDKFTKFTCDLCEYSTYHKQDLQQHKTYRHVNPNIAPGSVYDKTRPFPCTADGCLKFFKSRENLATHMKIHSGKD